MVCAPDTTDLMRGAEAEAGEVATETAGESESSSTT